MMMLSRGYLTHPPASLIGFIVTNATFPLGGIERKLGEPLKLCWKPGCGALLGHRAAGPGPCPRERQEVAPPGGPCRERSP
jgi:hypothetical protein